MFSLSLIIAGGVIKAFSSKVCIVEGDCILAKGRGGILVVSEEAAVLVCRVAVLYKKRDSLQRDSLQLSSKTLSRNNDTSGRFRDRASATTLVLPDLYLIVESYSRTLKVSISISTNESSDP